MSISRLAWQPDCKPISVRLFSIGLVLSATSFAQSHFIFPPPCRTPLEVVSQQNPNHRIPAEGGTAQFRLIRACAWNVASDANWLQLET